MTLKELKRVKKICGIGFKRIDIPAIWRKEEEPRCPKCGGEIKVILIGDESWDGCVNCGLLDI